MLSFATGNTGYRRAGLVLLLLQFALYVFCFPPLQGGIWSQTEPTVIALYVFAVLNSLWLAVGLAQRWIVAQAWPPIALCLLLWVGWQCIVTVISSSPWLSWFGPPESGLGTGWHVALLLLVMLATPLWNILSYRRIILMTAAANIVIQCVLHWLNPPDAATLYIPGSWAPAQWASYLAFMAGYFWIALMTTGYVRTFGAYSALTMCMLAVLFISHNKSAMPLLSVAMIVSLLIFMMRMKTLRRLLYPTKIYRGMAMLACLLPISWVVFSVYYGALPTDVAERQYPALLAEKDGSMGSRIVLNQIAVSTLRHEPWRWLTGGGWGRFADDTFKYALVDGVYAYHDGKRTANSIMVEGHAYNSHSQPMEALLALGLPGAAFWFGLPMLALAGVRRRYFWDTAPMILALVTLSYLWFEIVQCVPYQALCLAALCSASGGKRVGLGRTQWHIVVLACIAVLMAWSAWQQNKAMQYGGELLDATHSQPYEDYTVAWLTDDARRGGGRFRISALGYALTMADKIRQAPVDEIDRGWYGQFMKAAHEMALLPGVGVHVAYVEVWLSYKILMDVADPSFAELGHQASVTLPDAVLRLCMKAPERDDVATPMLLNLQEMTHNDVQRQLTILKNMLAVAPHHRGALWVMGHLLLQVPGREAEGQDMLRKAVALGVERVFPVNMEEIAHYK